jgi:hypothetical protein
MHVRRTCAHASEYEQSFKLSFNDAEAMWYETEIVTDVMQVRFQVLS